MNVFKTGILRGIPGLEVAKKLSSYFSSLNERAVVGKVLEKDTGGHILKVLLAHEDQAVLDADYDHLISLEYAREFFLITPPTAYTSLRALGPKEDSLPGRLFPSIVAIVTLTVVAVLAFLAMS